VGGTCAQHLAWSGAGSTPHPPALPARPCPALPSLLPSGFELAAPQPATIPACPPARPQCDQDWYSGCVACDSKGRCSKCGDSTVEENRFLGGFQPTPVNNTCICECRPLAGGLAATPVTATDCAVVYSVRERVQQGAIAVGHG